MKQGRKEMLAAGRCVLLKFQLGDFVPRICRAFPKLCSPHPCSGMGLVKGSETYVHMRGQDQAGTGMGHL